MSNARKHRSRIGRQFASSFSTNSKVVAMKWLPPTQPQRHQSLLYQVIQSVIKIFYIVGQNHARALPPSDVRLSRCP